MTDPEKRELSLRIATLADAAGMDTTLVWDAQDTCPQGHYLDPEIYIVSIGDLCDQCTTEYCNTHMELNEADWNDEEVANEDNPAWHPEWRIGKQSKDLTNPTYLLPLVEAWLFQAMTKRDVLIEWQGSIGQWNAEFSMITQGDGWTVLGTTYDPDRTIAEAQAFAAALEGEASHD